MLLPFKYTQLFKRDGAPDEEEVIKLLPFDDYYEKYDAILDLSVVTNIACNFFDKKKISSVTLQSGNVIVALINVYDLHDVIQRARDEYNLRNILTGLN